MVYLIQQYDLIVNFYTYLDLSQIMKLIYHGFHYHLIQLHV